MLNIFCTNHQNAKLSLYNTDRFFGLQLRNVSVLSLLTIIWELNKTCYRRLWYHATAILSPKQRDRATNLNEWSKVSIVLVPCADLVYITQLTSQKQWLVSLLQFATHESFGCSFIYLILPRARSVRFQHHLRPFHLQWYLVWETSHQQSNESVWL